MLLILFLSQLPIVVLFTYIYIRDRHGREPIILLVKTTILGALVSIPVIAAEVAFSAITTLGFESSGVGLLTYALLGIAAIEEGGKFLVLRLYNYNKPELDEPYDGIMYAVAVSLGFAAIENLFFIIGFGNDIALTRALTAVPMHAMTGVIMGYFVGRAKFYDLNGGSRKDLWLGFLLAALAHGLYDYYAFLEHWIFIVILVIEIRLGLKAIKMYQEVHTA